MGRTPKANDAPVEMIRAHITYTKTGYPVTLETAQSFCGPACRKADEEGWFWVAATPLSAANIRFHGHRAVGTETTTVIPFEIGADYPERSTCQKVNDRVPHKPHRMPASTLTLLCQGFAVPAEQTEVTSFRSFCHCREPLLDEREVCLVCNTQWETED